MNAATEIEMPLPFVFTDNAANKVKELIEEEGNPELKLRVFVTGGGCSGFQYGFTFVEFVLLRVTNRLGELRALARIATIKRFGITKDECVEHEVAIEARMNLRGAQ